jgi:hypothetical protein
LDPNIVIRNPDAYPRLLLRGIYDVMERERKAGRGSLMERYRKGFNVVVFAMVRADPPRLRVVAGKGTDVAIVGFGWEREGDVMRSDERKETTRKLKELYRWLGQLKEELDGADAQNPNVVSGDRPSPPLSGAPGGY